MANNALSFDKVLAAFADYLAQDDCVEVVKTSRGYAVIDLILPPSVVPN